ncbi:MAG: type-F conjugative transfer system pilin assembly protein TrbC [Parachlamydiaceae bacterium]
MLIRLLFSFFACMSLAADDSQDQLSKQASQIISVSSIDANEFDPSSNEQLKETYEQAKAFSEKVLNKKELKQKILDQLEVPEKRVSLSSSGKCHVNVSNEKEHELLIFLSFSAPNDVWLRVSKEIEKYGGIIVLRGLPNNSFLELSKRIQALTKLGVTAPIQINPILFDRYKVQAVPCYVVKNEIAFDKVSGNASLAYALEEMSRNGETGIANRILHNRLSP